jgi:hypothetical protein
VEIGGACMYSYTDSTHGPQLSSQYRLNLDDCFAY